MNRKCPTGLEFDTHAVRVRISAQSPSELFVIFKFVHPTSTGLESLLSNCMSKWLSSSIRIQLLQS